MPARIAMAVDVRPGALPVMAGVAADVGEVVAVIRLWASYDRLTFILNTAFRT
jgi:hypothetical protein